VIDKLAGEVVIVTCSLSTMLVGSEAVSLEVLVSPPPDTAALLVTLAAGFVTLTVNEIGE